MATAAAGTLHINNFYGKISSVDGQLLSSNIIDNAQFLEEL